MKSLRFFFISFPQLKSHSSFWYVCVVVFIVSCCSPIERWHFAFAVGIWYNRILFLLDVKRVLEADATSWIYLHKSFSHLGVRFPSLCLTTVHIFRMMLLLLPLLVAYLANRGRRLRGNFHWNGLSSIQLLMFQERPFYHSNGKVSLLLSIILIVRFSMKFNRSKLVIIRFNWYNRLITYSFVWFHPFSSDWAWYFEIRIPYAWIWNKRIIYPNFSNFGIEIHNST